MVKFKLLNSVKESTKMIIRMKTLRSIKLLVLNS